MSLVRKPLEGAVFKLVDTNNNDVSPYTNLTTDKHGKVKVSNLRPGTYKFIEIALLNITFYEQNLLNLQSIEVRKKLYL